MDTNAVTRRIRSLCMDRGITYKQMADELGVPEGTIKSWIYGERKMSLENAILIADYFSVPLDTIAVRKVPAAVV